LKVGKIMLCSKCKEDKSVDEFQKDKSRPNGYYPWCKGCTNEYRSERGKVYRQVKRRQVLIHYGGTPPRCACCGEESENFLAIDHIEGNGGKERKALNGRLFTQYLIKEGFPDGYRVLCHNCNHSLGIHGYCPHKGRPIDSFCGEMQQILESGIYSK
jgi:uncharacterized CHY-type Zn-finger protein